MNNLVEKIMYEVKKLPIDMQLEVLHFVQFLEEKTKKSKALTMPLIDKETTNSIIK